MPRQEVPLSRSLIHTNGSLPDFPLTALKFFFGHCCGLLNSPVARQDLRSLFYLFVVNAHADYGSPAAHAFFIETAVLCEAERIFMRLPKAWL